MLSDTFEETSDEKKPSFSLRRTIFMTMLLIVVSAGAAHSLSAGALSESRSLPPTEVAATAGSPMQLLADAIGTNGLVLLGEMHGTKEIPALVGDLVAHETEIGEDVVLALEITSIDQTLVNSYLTSPGEPADQAALVAGEHWQEPTHDGRDSQAMFGLIEHIRKLHNRGANVAIDFFDVPGVGERDKRMADHLRSVVLRSPRAIVLVLTGNIHAMTARPPWKMFNDGKQIEPPMTAGRYLADLHPLSINISAATGEAWVCMDRECRPHTMRNKGVIEEATLELAEPSKSAWNATLTLPKFTASPPAVDGKLQ